MPTIGLFSSMIAGRPIDVRQILPGPRQNIPRKRLKNNANTPPGSFGRAVQRSEAVCELRRRHCGLEIRK
ncbi:hypothetical protein [Bradyrhizobium oligotrophicum]|uniref:hypothetical protein n=1 Tax=Bradyrhizobium oligotrophicum TaxID=44255 RepID=UPI001360B45E|nr:hypothetical protein [Bradyrhizobium oligotrophicum]